METPPQSVGDAELVCFTFIDGRHHFTGRCKQIVAGKLMGPIAGLAICRYPGDTGFYLFGCDHDWQVVTDTVRSTIEEAKEQAKYEYASSESTWVHVT